MTLVNEGRPVFVGGDDDRIGRGPWARWVATSVVPDEASPRAERGRILARTGHVHSVRIVPGEISALVIGSSGAEYGVSMAADPVPPRVWAAVIGSPRGRSLFEAAAAGREQSLQLEHVMTVDWDEPLIPPGKVVRRSCTCPDADRSGTCKHVIALAYVFAGCDRRRPVAPARVARLHRRRGAARAGDAAARADGGRLDGRPVARARPRPPAPGRLGAQAARPQRPRRRRHRSA